MRRPDIHINVEFCFANDGMENAYDQECSQTDHGAVIINFLSSHMLLDEFRKSEPMGILHEPCTFMEGAFNTG